jgi:hypothetical protein
MKMMDAVRFRSSISFLITILLLSGVGLPVPARASGDVVVGRVVDSLEEPVVGFRVVFRLADGAEVALSQPTDVAGEYSVLLPSGTSYIPVAVFSAGGVRFALENQQAVEVAPGARRDIVLAVTFTAEAEEEFGPFPGSDRLFLSFVEDTAIASKYHSEGQLDIALYDSADHYVSRAVFALQLEEMPRLEFGGRFGLGGAKCSCDEGRDQGGVTDLDLWGKLYIGPRFNSRLEFAAGALLTIGTGDEESGLGWGGLRSKLFGAIRYSFPKFVLTANAGVRMNEDTRVNGTVLEGEVAPSVGLGLLYPVNDSLMVVGEATYEGERFEGWEADARVLAGVNWQLFPHGVLRLAVSGGLADGAPDTQLLAGYSFDF